MDNIGIANVGIASVAAITVICYLVGLIVKAVPNMADKYIPICCGVAGAALGLPVLTGAVGATHVLKAGTTVTLDSDSGRVTPQ